jgi:cell division protein DivIC
MNKKKTGRTAGKREKKQEPLFRRHGASVKIICAVLVTLALALGVKSVSLYEKREAYREQEAELEAQIEEEKERSKEIEEYTQYVQSDEYIKDVAEEKLGLVDPNEVIFTPAE